MRKYINLIETALRTDEAPIGDISYMGGDAPASFRADDVGIMQSDKWKQKVRRVLEKAPILIHLAFVNHDKGYDDPENIGNPDRKLGDGVTKASGIMTPQEFERAYGHPIKADPSALTAVFTFNEGTERRPMTPWIIAHRLTHLIEEADYQNERPFGVIMMGLQFGFMQLGYDVIGTNSVDNIVPLIGTTKAARDGALVNIGEFVAECFAQYLVQGRIILNPLEQSENPLKVMSDTRRLYPKLVDAMDENPSFVIPDPEAVNQWLAKWASSTEKAFGEILKNMVGKVVVM